MRFASVVFAGIIILVPVSAHSTTWRVEPDGSGDWLTIQQAVDFASSGDTISIGPGRYDQLHVNYWGSTSVVYFRDNKECVFIGSQVDSVIIGPEEYIPHTSGIFTDASIFQEFRAITFQNLDDGLVTRGETLVRGCKFIKCSNGISSSLYSDESITIRACFFEGREWENTSNAVSLKNSGRVLLDYSEIHNMGINLLAIENATVDNCKLKNTFYSESASFNSADVIFTKNEVGGQLGVQRNSHIELRNNHFLFSQGGCNLSLADSTTSVEVYDNIFEGGPDSTIKLLNCPSIIGSGNHILNGGSSYTIFTFEGGCIHPATVDLRNNYWGVADSSTIADWILDRNDDPSMINEVQFIPFSSGPLPAERKSLGDVKAMFR